ncbi:MAG: STAS-like domain-containing protein [Patescibacteria group bacterium]
MLIELKKFGTTLTSRDDGREAYSAIQPTLKNISVDEGVEIDFNGVNTFTPSWGDEFITPLFKNFGDKLILKHLKNPSVKITLNTIEKANKVKLNKSF